jgi:crotonobetainyl-CoA:carnitine CoA-transferase CaiB-like acyl-CoA transferase
LPGNPIRLSGSARPEARPAPALGEHTDAIRREMAGGAES